MCSWSNAMFALMMSLHVYRFVGCFIVIPLNRDLIPLKHASGISTVNLKDRMFDQRFLYSNGSFPVIM